MTISCVWPKIGKGTPSPEMSTYISLAKTVTWTLLASKQDRKQRFCEPLGLPVRCLPHTSWVFLSCLPSKTVQPPWLWVILPRALITGWPPLLQTQAFSALCWIPPPYFSIFPGNMRTFRSALWYLHLLESYISGVETGNNKTWVPLSK